MNAKIYKQVDDFSKEQIQKFDTMHRVLREYNSRLRKETSPIAPAFTDDEMRGYSIYRQLLIAAESGSLDT